MKISNLLVNLLFTASGAYSASVWAGPFGGGNRLIPRDAIIASANAISAVVVGGAPPDAVENGMSIWTSGATFEGVQATIARTTAFGADRSEIYDKLIDAVNLAADIMQNTYNAYISVLGEDGESGWIIGFLQNADGPCAAAQNKLIKRKSANLSERQTDYRNVLEEYICPDLDCDKEPC